MMTKAKHENFIERNILHLLMCKRVKSMAKHNHDGYKTAKEVGAMLDLSADYIRCLIRKGKIKAEKFGSVWLIDLHSFKKIKRVRFPRMGEIKNGEISA